MAVLASINGEKITFLAVCGPEAVKKGREGRRSGQERVRYLRRQGRWQTGQRHGSGADLLKLDDALASVDDFVASKLSRP